MSNPTLFAIVPLFDTKEKLYRAIQVPELKDITVEWKEKVDNWCEGNGKLRYQFDNCNLLVPHKDENIKNHFWGVKPTKGNTELLKIFNSKVVAQIKTKFAKFQINNELIKKLTDVEKELAKIEEKKTTEKMLKENEKKEVKKAALPAPPKGSQTSRIEKATQEQAKRIAKNLEKTVYAKPEPTKAIAKSKTSKKLAKKS